MRFLPREIYHTAEWSSDFLFAEEKQKYQLYTSKYGKFFGPCKFSSQTEENYELSSAGEKVPESLKNQNMTAEFKKMFNSEGPISTKHKRNIRNAFENKLLVNKGYCFVTYATTDQAKLVMLRLNRARESYDLNNVLMATLKEDLEPYELDNDFIFRILKRIKSRYLEYLHEVQKRGENLPQSKEELLENSKEYVDRLLAKKDVRKTMEELLERELFNDYENTTIGSLKPSENYDKESIGRQNSLEITNQDFMRLKKLIDGRLNEGIEEFKKKARSSHAVLSDYISPLNQEKVAKDLRHLKYEINRQAEKFYSEKFTKTEKDAVNVYIHNNMMKLIYENDFYNFNPSLPRSELFKLLKINDEKFDEISKDKPAKLGGLTNELIEMAEKPEEESQFTILIKETERRERFFLFIKYLQRLLLGKFDAKMLQMFDQKGVPLDQNEIMIKYCKDVNGKDYLPQAEKVRVMEYLSPEDEDEKLKILKYEEEKIKFWEEMTHEQKAKFVDAASNSLPFQPLYEHEMGIPEKIFKPNLKTGQTIDQLVDQLNKEADLGVEYVSVEDSPQGQVIYKVVKPAYRVNIQKMDKFDLGKLKKLAEDDLRKVDKGKSPKEIEKKIEKKMKETMEEIRRGKGIYDDEMMKNREMKRIVEQLMKVTPFSRAGNSYRFFFLNISSIFISKFYVFFIIVIFLKNLSFSLLRDNFR